MSGQLCDALRFVAELQKQASGASREVAVIELPMEPDHVYGLMTGEGFTRVEAQAPARNHALGGVDQVVPFVESAMERFGDQANISVWYSPNQVVVLLTDEKIGSRLGERARVPLKHSDEFLLLKKLETDEVWLTPKKFVFFLRTKLADCIPDLETLLPIFRSLKFSTTETGHNRSSVGRESLGREIDASAVSEYSQIPEEIVCEVRVFDDPSIQRRSKVRCAVEVNASNGDILLTTLSGELRRAADDEVQAIGDLLSKHLTCPVFFGSP